jgi:hypothetical protein
MRRRSSCTAALIVALLLGVVGFLPARPASAAGAPTPPVQVDSWAWCGVNPDDPVAATAARAMALAGGIDATFGPCNIPTNDYTPAHTANRYVDFDVYMRLVQLNASVGMRTVVYDDRLWSTDPLVRTTAINFWMPVIANIAAWDMGDEFDPNGPEWSILKTRWAIVQNDAEARTGVRPFANFLPTTTALNKALVDLPGSAELLSFAKYDGDKGVSIAQAYDSRANLMCGVNELDHNGLVATPATIRSGMDALKAAGCDQLLVFGGFPVYDDTDDFFGDTSVVDRTGAPTNRAPATQEGAGHSVLIPVVPTRLLETRSGPGLGTVDSQFNAIGLRPADSVLELGIVGRAQMPAWARTVVLNVTVTGGLGPGFLTVYPCGETRPTSSNLNYDIGTTRAVAVISRIGGNGAVCVYTQTPVHVIVDLTGFYAFGASFTGIVPARYLDSRVGPEFTTIDGQFAGQGRVAGGAVTAVKVAGRGGIPTDASAVAVNVTAINPTLAGFITVFPCGEQIPLASTLNFTPGAIVPNAAVVKVGTGGAICLYSNTETDVVVDVNGYDSAQAIVRLFEPTRVLETRSGQVTADGLAEFNGPRPSDSVLELAIGGRVGVPTTIRAVVLNITVTEATGPGFVTVFPCGGTRPIASTLNYGLGSTVANLAVATTSKDGKVCIYTQTATHLIVDLSGYHT